MYRDDPKSLDKREWANSVDPDQEQSDQGLHCLPTSLHLLETLLGVKTTMFKFQDTATAIFDFGATKFLGFSRYFIIF